MSLGEGTPASRCSGCFEGGRAIIMLHHGSLSTSFLRLEGRSIMKWLFLLFIVLSMAPGLALADCYHGCADTNLNVGDYIRIESTNESPCSPGCGEDAIIYTFRITTACGFSTITNPPQTFCS